MEQLENLPIPVICVITGFCLGGGLELALSCDVICATVASQLGLPEVTLGIIPGFGGTQRLSRRCGIGIARRMILSAERLDATTAHQYGIVDLLISEDRKELTAMTDRLEKLSPLALEAAKIALSVADSKNKDEGLKKERELFVEVLKSEDAKEGMKAFFEKRPAKFVGK
jgi:enoyl-CoA hydratase